MCVQVTDKDDQFYPGLPGIDVIHAPAGVHLVASLEASKILINLPVDSELVASGNPSVYDITPDRGMATQPGANTFVIGGANFDAIKGEFVYCCLPASCTYCTPASSTTPTANPIAVLNVAIFCTVYMCSPCSQQLHI